MGASEGSTEDATSESGNGRRPSRKWLAYVGGILLLLAIGVVLVGNLAGAVVLYDSEATPADEPIDATAGELNLKVEQLGGNWAKIFLNENETRSDARFFKNPHPGADLRNQTVLGTTVTVHESIEDAKRAYDGRVEKIRKGNNPDGLDLGHEAILYKDGAAVRIVFRDSNVVGVVAYARPVGFWFELSAIEFAKLLHSNIYAAQ